VILDSGVGCRSLTKFDREALAANHSLTYRGRTDMEVNGIGPVSGSQPIRKVAQPATPPPTAEARPTSPTDELELTSVNSAAPSQVDLKAEFQSQRIAQIQQQIADGTYETPEKLDVAVDRMLESLLAE
jgi:negative regulator of flagellin synthesis FlgM